MHARFLENWSFPCSPRYTVGLGGSGGAIQQYIIAQNPPRLLNALVPISAYPDMITQSIYVGDCELMEYCWTKATIPAVGP